MTAITRRGGVEWVLVPREPTEAMLRAGYEAPADDRGRHDNQRELHRVTFGPVWRAMLAAAPEPPQPETSDSGRLADGSLPEDWYNAACDPNRGSDW